MRNTALSIILMFAVTGLAAGAAEKVDLTGTWVLDKARSEGVPPDMEQTLTVKQAGDRVDVEAKISGGRGEQTVADSFVLDGKEKDFAPALVGGGTGKGKRTSAWTAEGDGFDASEEATIEGPEGEVNVKAKRRWRVSQDGKTLTIEMTFEGPNGVVNSKRVFAKK